MLSFVVFDSPTAYSSPLQSTQGFALRHAHAFHAEDLPVQAEIRLDALSSDDAKLISCDTRTPDSVGLSLQFVIDPVPADLVPPSVAAALNPSGLGVLTIQTCLLPPRDKPYLLSLELARHRLMMFFNKLEDWALFDLPADHPAFVLFEAARRAFTDAVVEAANITSPTPPTIYSPKADHYARLSLALAMEASELLTLTQARQQFSRRISGELAAAAAKIAVPSNAISDHEAAATRSALLGTSGVILPSPPLVGVAINPNTFSPALTKAAATCADFVCMPLRWVDMEPTEGKYLFSNTDRWIEWAVRSARLPIVGGPIIELRRGCVPEWMYIWEHDYETLRELVYEHTRNIVTRYRRTVSTWTVCSGLHVASNFALSFEQMMDLTRLVATIVRKLQPSAKIQIQIDQPWGEYVARSTRSIPPMMYAEMVLQAGINPDLFAMRIQMGQPEPGESTRDLLTLSSLLDKFAGLEKPLTISALSAPSRTPDPDSIGVDGEMEPGYYRNPWSPQAQADWISRVLGVCTSKPYVHSIAWHELYDPPIAAGPQPTRTSHGRANELHHIGLIDTQGHPKPALDRLAQVRSAIRAKSSPLNLREPAGVGA